MDIQLTFVDNLTFNTIIGNESPLPAYSSPPALMSGTPSPQIAPGTPPPQYQEEYQQDSLTSLSSTTSLWEELDALFASPSSPSSFASDDDTWSQMAEWSPASAFGEAGCLVNDYEPTIFWLLWPHCIVWSKVFVDIFPVKPHLPCFHYLDW